MSKKYRLSGITWDDVADALEDLERELHVYASYRIERQERCLGQPMGLLVVLDITGTRRSGAEGYRRTVKASWPTYAHKTMPGLLLYLIHAAHESVLGEAPRFRKQVKTPVYPPG